MALSTTLIPVAKDLLTRFGTTGSYLHTAEGAFDPTTGGLTGTTTEAYSGVLYATNYSRQDIDGTIIRENDVLVYAERMSRVPEVKDTVTFLGKTYTILNVNPIQSDGNDIIYLLQCRI